jgi:hypothetical protein
LEPYRLNLIELLYSCGIAFRKIEYTKCHKKSRIYFIANYRTVSFILNHHSFYHDNQHSQRLIQRKIPQESHCSGVACKLRNNTNAAESWPRMHLKIIHNTHLLQILRSNNFMQYRPSHDE